MIFHICLLCIQLNASKISLSFMKHLLGFFFKHILGFGEYSICKKIFEDKQQYFHECLFLNILFCNFFFEKNKNKNFQFKKTSILRVNLKKFKKNYFNNYC